MRGSPPVWEAQIYSDAVDAGEGCSTQSSRADGSTAQALLLSLDAVTFTLTKSPQRGSDLCHCFLVM